MLVRLGGDLDRHGFDQFEKEHVKAQKLKDIETRLGADVQVKEFDLYERKLKEAKDRASKRDAFKATLGADFDGRAFSAYERELKKAEHGNDDMIKSQGRLRTSFGNVYGKGGALFAAAGGLYGLQAAGRAVIGTATDINESLTKNQVLFGKYAGDVAKFSDSTAKSFGISKKAALEATGTFGNLFVALDIGPKKAAAMSVELTKLAADLASFNNASPEEALEAIRSGLVGETEPLRKFGVNLNDATLRAEALSLGLVKNTKESLDPQTKALAVNALLFKQTEKAQGDFARTSDGLANQQRILKARFSDAAGELGTRLLPVVTKAAQGLNSLADAFSGSGSSSRGLSRDIRRLKGDFEEVAPAFKVGGAIIGGVFTGMADAARRRLGGILDVFDGLKTGIRGAVKIITGLLTLNFDRAWDGVKDIFSGGAHTAIGAVKLMTAPLLSAVHVLDRALGGAFSNVWDGIVGTARGFVNRIIDVINVLPFVDIGHVGGSSKSAGSKQPGLNAPLGNLGSLPKPKSAQGAREGGLVTAPIVLMGEEAPEHPEWVIPLNPAYRERAVGLWAAAGHDLGIQGFARGGLLDAAKGTLLGGPFGALGGAAGALAGATGAGDLVGKLPSNPGGPLSGMFGHILSEAKDYLVDKAKSLVPSFGGGGGGGGGNVHGLVPQVLRALAWARSHGWRGGVNSGFRTYAEQAVLYARYLAGGNIAAPPGQSNHESGQAVDVSDIPGFAAAMASAPPGSRLYSRVPGDPVHFSVTGYKKGGRFDGGISPKEIPAFARAVWGKVSGTMGAHFGMPPIVVGDPDHDFSGAYADYQPKSNQIHLTAQMVRDLGKSKGRAHNYALLSVIHEFAHAYQNFGLSHNEIEGGADQFAHFEAPRAYGALGVAYSKAPWAYPNESAWVRKNRKPSWWQRGQFRGSTHGTPMLGGIGYAKGGKTKGKAKPKPTLSASENSGIRRSVNRGEQGIKSFEDDIQGLEREYGQMDRRFGLTDEQFLIENADGSTTVDQAAVGHRVHELSKLIAQRRKIRSKIETYREALKKLMGSLRKAINTLKGALAAATGKSRQKERGGYRDAISAYQDRLGELRGTFKDLGGDITDSDIDLTELLNEAKVVGGTTGESALTSLVDDFGTGFSSGPSPDAQAQIDQANAATAAANANLVAAGQYIQGITSPGDIGQSGFANALAAAGGPNIIFQSYVPPSPSQARELGTHVVAGIGYQNPTPSPRVNTGA